MDISTIEWMIELADEFEKGEVFGKPCFNYVHNKENNLITYGKMSISKFYPILLQRSIERINTTHGDDSLKLISRYSVAKKRWCFRIEKYGSTVHQTDWYDLIDQAKEQILEYVHKIS